MENYAYQEVSFGALLGTFMIMAVLSASISARDISVPVVYYKLPNGLRVVISEDHLAKRDGEVFRYLPGRNRDSGRLRQGEGPDNVVWRSYGLRY